MTPSKDFERKLITEYDISKETLVSKFSTPLEKQAAKEAIDSTLLTCSAAQAAIIIKELPSEYLAGIYIESDYLSRNVPAYVGFDFSAAPKTGLDKLTRQTIGHIGHFNEELANELKLRYGNLVENNGLVNDITKRGWTKGAEAKLTKMGLGKEAINLIKHQTTTNKMLQILEQQGIKGGMHPTEVAKLLQPHIKGIFGNQGVTIDNIGGVRRVLTIDADGVFKWQNKVITHPFHTTTKNYADIIARSAMLDANRLGGYHVLQQSGFVKGYRSIAVMDERTGYLDAMMHGQIVKWADGPQYHPRCRCILEPIWKKNTGLTNRRDDYYFDKRDNWFWKQHQLKKYNMTLPKDSKIPNANFLPASELEGMPDKRGMREIRKGLLK